MEHPAIGGALPSEPSKGFRRNKLMDSPTGEFRAVLRGHIITRLAKILESRVVPL